MNKEIYQKLKALKPKFKDMNIKRLALFGSQANGDYHDNSDIDLLVDFIETPGMIAFVDTKFTLENYMGCPVDLVSFQGLKQRGDSDLIGKIVDI